MIVRAPSLTPDTAIDDAAEAYGDCIVCDLGIDASDDNDCEHRLYRVERGGEKRCMDCGGVMR